MLIINITVLCSRENVNQMCLRESSTLGLHCIENFDDYRKFELKTRSYKASLGSCFSFSQEEAALNMIFR
ncbi:unnamed protein product [Moneuplotes crassus]|uniref:Uncharacterized protein n=1 Tax=Euplotes crassus TaxID=5936 RepID=A0AAD2D5A3_EUPCR|nr:unnamed protein product [Moneuplotes crassus]